MTEALTILEEAEQVATGDRHDHYGHPLDNHSCTAEMWTSYLKRAGVLQSGKRVTGLDVAMLNVLQKCSRAANLCTRDTLVDIAGYARNVEMMWEEVERRERGSS